MAPTSSSTVMPTMARLRVRQSAAFPYITSRSASCSPKNLHAFIACLTCSAFRLLTPVSDSDHIFLTSQLLPCIWAQCLQGGCVFNRPVLLFDNKTACPRGHCHSRDSPETGP